MKKIIKPKKKYHEKQLKNAVEAINQGMSVVLAARTFRVPRSTLRFRFRNQNKDGKPGPPTLLSKKEEESLVNFILQHWKSRSCKRREGIQRIVTKFLKDTNIKNPFKNNKPGRKWLHLFLQRHPKLKY